MDCTYISSYLQYLQSLLVKPLVFRGPDPLLGTEDGYQLYEFDLSSASSKHIACPKLHGRVKDISLSLHCRGVLSSGLDWESCDSLSAWPNDNRR